jgi:hypothetical protein
MKNLRLVKLLTYFIPIVVLIFVLITCKKDVEPITPITPTDVIEIETFVQVATGSITSSGGIITVNKPENAIDGMTINAQSGTFSDNKQFTVSTATIKSHKFGQYFNPITPVIKISNGGDYANKIIEVKIPIKLPSGHFPLAFFFDEVNGKLEAVPVLKYDNTSVTVGTRHFSTSFLAQQNMMIKQAKVKAGESYSNIIISSLSESVINQTPTIASGYKPTIDDWEFINYGSYIASGGHCAGQNMAAMWYYFEKKPTEGNLFNKFSDNSILWQDNAKGYKFCSVIHQDLDWEGNLIGIFDKYIDKNQELDKFKLYMIAGAMLVTGEPQGIGIYRQKGTNTDGTPIYGGHDLICYQVSVSTGKLYISDPNTPGIAQTINYSNNKFKPYSAKPNGNEPSTAYPFVTYYAKTAYIEWDKISNRWDELLNKTIGTVAPNTFPAYTIWAKSGLGFELKDNMVVSSDTLITNIICPTSEVFYNVQNQKLIGMNVFDQNGNRIDKVINGYTSMVKLNPGLNKIGYYVYGWRIKSKYTDGTYIDKFVDFKWLNITYTKLTPSNLVISDGSFFLDGDFEVSSESPNVPRNTWIKINSFGGFFDPTTLKESNGTVTGSFLHSKWIPFQVSFNPVTFELTGLKYNAKTTYSNGDVDEESINIAPIPVKYFQKIESQSSAYVTYYWEISGTDVLKYVTESKKYWTSGTTKNWTNKMVNADRNSLTISVEFKKQK